MKRSASPVFEESESDEFSQGPERQPGQKGPGTTGGELALARRGTYGYKLGRAGMVHHSQTTRASSLLLQMIPYRPPKDMMPPGMANRLVTVDPSTFKDKRIVMDEATRIVQLLLNKWTTAGSAPLCDVLGNSMDKDDRKG